MKEITQLDLINYLKNYGFVYPNSEIYNGLANAWDFGPLGVLLKNNLKKLWWKEFVTKEENVFGLDSNIIYNSDVWKASGHLSSFVDPLIDCKSCKNRFRADKLIEDFNHNLLDDINENENGKLYEIILFNKIKCPNCNEFNWTTIRQFNLMFKTFQGVTENDLNTLYLRPETAQGIFINFKNILRSTRTKIPFAVAQIGKSFRNEITPGNFIFRTREFEQMEIECFVRPEFAIDTFKKYLLKLNNFFTNECQISEEFLRLYKHPKEKLSHYSKMTVDFEFKFAHGWGELCGLAHRGDYDLNVHANNSKKDMTYFDALTNEKFLPHIIEPSIGVERLIYAIISSAYKIEEVADKEEREILNLPLILCPYKITVLPLTNKLNDIAKEIYKKIIAKNISASFDTSGSIGKRYRRQDAIATMYCITIDFDTLDKNTITIRDRNTMEQKIINLDELDEFLNQIILKSN